MNVMVIALKHVEAKRKTRLRGFEYREIMQVFYLVMDVELVQHKLELGHELLRKFCRPKKPGSELRGDVANRNGKLAEHHMP